MNIKNYNGEKIIIGADASSVVLEYNGLNKIETTTAGVNITGAIYVNGSEFTGGGGDSYANADVDAHLNQSDPTTGHVLSWNGTDYAWVAQAGSGSSYSDSDAVAAVVASDLDMKTQVTTIMFLFLLIYTFMALGTEILMDFQKTTNQTNGLWNLILIWI